MKNRVWTGPKHSKLTGKYASEELPFGVAPQFGWVLGTSQTYAHYIISEDFQCREMDEFSELYLTRKGVPMDVVKKYFRLNEEEEYGLVK